ncbi:MAG: RidA family protein [Anaerolineales bacterium]|nr:RidA family protein [Chloroflexota bacterium]MBL6981678.1 RidA family protein [Anaerolineales bacterium]
MTKEVITTKDAPKAIGPYSAGVRTGNLIFSAGQLGIDPLTGEFVSDEVVEQTRQALKNLKAILDAGGSAMENVLKTTVFLRDMNDFAAMNAVYAEFFTENFPARSAVQVARLPKDAAVEIEAVAVVSSQ